MDIYDELDRIRGQGFKIDSNWGVDVFFCRIGDSKKSTYYKRVCRTENEQWKHCMYRAILEFDERPL